MEGRLNGEDLGFIILVFCGTLSIIIVSLLSLASWCWDKFTTWFFPYSYRMRIELARKKGTLRYLKPASRTLSQSYKKLYKHLQSKSPAS